MPLFDRSSGPSWWKEWGKSVGRSALGVADLPLRAIAGAAEMGGAAIGVRPLENPIYTGLMKTRSKLGELQEWNDDPLRSGLYARDPRFEQEHGGQKIAQNVIEGGIPWILAGAATGGAALPVLAGLGGLAENTDIAHGKDYTGYEAMARAAVPAAIEGGMFAAMGPAMRYLKGNPATASAFPKEMIKNKVREIPGTIQHGKIHDVLKAGADGLSKLPGGKVLSAPMSMGQKIFAGGAGGVLNKMTRGALVEGPYFMAQGETTQAGQVVSGITSPEEWRQGHTKEAMIESGLTSVVSGAGFGVFGVNDRLKHEQQVKAINRFAEGKRKAENTIGAATDRQVQNTVDEVNLTGDPTATTVYQQKKMADAAGEAVLAGNDPVLKEPIGPVSREELASLQERLDQQLELVSTLGDNDPYLDQGMKEYENLERTLAKRTERFEYENNEGIVNDRLSFATLAPQERESRLDTLYNGIESLEVGSPVRNAYELHFDELLKQHEALNQVQPVEQVQPAEQSQQAGLVQPAELTDIVPRHKTLSRKLQLVDRGELNELLHRGFLVDELDAMTYPQIEEIIKNKSLPEEFVPELPQAVNAKEVTAEQLGKDHVITQVTEAVNKQGLAKKPGLGGNEGSIQVTPQYMIDAVKAIHAKVKTFAQFSKELVNQFGQAVKAHALKLWNYAKSVQPGMSTESVNAEGERVPMADVILRAKAGADKNDIKSVIAGKRKALTITDADPNLERFQNLKEGDTLDLDGLDGSSTKVRITKPLYPLKGSGLTAKQWMDLENRDIGYFNKNVAPHIDRAHQIQYEKIEQPTLKPDQVTHHAIASPGAESLWDRIGDKWKVKSTHSVQEETRSAKELSAKSNKSELESLSNEELEAGYALLGKALGYKIVERDFASRQQALRAIEIDKSDTVISVDKMKNGRPQETLRAIKVAISQGKPVHVFDPSTSDWYAWNGKKFVISHDVPTVSQDFAGIGSRFLEEYQQKASDGTIDKNREYRKEYAEAARIAIENVYKKSFGEETLSQKEDLNPLSPEELKVRETIDEEGPLDLEKRAKEQESAAWGKDLEEDYSEQARFEDDVTKELEGRDELEAERIENELKSEYANYKGEENDEITEIGGEKVSREDFDNLSVVQDSALLVQLNKLKLRTHTGKEKLHNTGAMEKLAKTIQTAQELNPVRVNVNDPWYLATEAGELLYKLKKLNETYTADSLKNIIGIYKDRIDSYPDRVRDFFKEVFPKEQAAYDEKIDEMKPKANGYDLIAGADGSLCLTDAAKELQQRPKDLIAWMSANQWIYKRAGCSSWIGYQDRIQAGYLEHKSNIVMDAMGNERIRDQVRITGKGLAKLAKQFARDINGE